MEMQITDYDGLLQRFVRTQAVKKWAGPDVPAHFLLLIFIIFYICLKLFKKVWLELPNTKVVNKFI